MSHTPSVVDIYHYTVQARQSPPSPNIVEYEGARGPAMPPLQLAQAAAGENYHQKLASGVKPAIPPADVPAGREK